MPGCIHSICEECFKQNFTLAIREKGVKHFTCPVCDYSNEDMSQDYVYAFLNLVINSYKVWNKYYSFNDVISLSKTRLFLDKDLHVLCLDKLNDFHLTQEKNYVCCPNVSQ